ncbi:MAG: hypothetical protein A2381_11195 [Bdellovibrionales bacterium RIFOXYB1_FULL_37_110]|nr:MAG: hypothetical protein A2181_01515 [Bdellovibrionales bacterium RIFOXYA1_FULL_38_20]OFZ48606.1 MAG: hypothetical protein A2417_09680 [Bdellovibrionales bacterium RIFOXYC1_FULL_37_79]OFZ58415.1 MAG: hypothetical protein A2381_11195 [Bdellovibrionales bacterium RIFOXYB1_FULL_37_110]OFZ61459.1 MAG: hypothetical protein A2577_00115 [Bdellovibrionales bacterium RIFOXYD1_FULL_36_51]
MAKSLTKTIGAILRKVWVKEKFTHQTFTYFIPAPPERKTGYREKQFDKIVFELLNNKGYEIISIHTQNCHQQSGMWVILELQTLNSNAQADLDFPSAPISKEQTAKPKVTTEIEGFYYLD